MLVYIISPGPFREESPFISRARKLFLLVLSQLPSRWEAMQRWEEGRGGSSWLGEVFGEALSVPGRELFTEDANPLI